ncbi:MAG: NlpC/P60 family protein [Methylophaga sp.]|nr:NlpC/P60 family protein [Methylophaga sp.]
MSLIKPQFSPVLDWPLSALMLSVIFILSNCQSAHKAPVSDRIEITPPLEYSQQRQRDPLLEKLYQQHEKWYGTPYQLGGNNRKGIDCSGFVQVTYRDVFGVDLPPTTTQQFRSGPRINRSELKTGDLVFFRHGRHVGIYLENQKFLHASTTRGVMISDMKNPYWARHYWRVISIPNISNPEVSPQINEQNH